MSARRLTVCAEHLTTSSAAVTNTRRNVEAADRVYVKQDRLPSQTIATLETVDPLPTPPAAASQVHLQRPAPTPAAATTHHRNLPCYLRQAGDRLR